MRPNRSATDNEQQWDLVYLALNRIAMRLGLACDRSMLELGEWAEVGSDRQWSDVLETGCRSLGIRLMELDRPSVSAMVDLVSEGHPLLLVHQQQLQLLVRFEYGHFEYSSLNLTEPGSRMDDRRIHWRRLSRQLKKQKFRFFVAQDELECRALAAASAQPTASQHGGDHHHHHPGPLKRLISMLRMDTRDLLTVLLFAFVASLLALATPLAVESLVNVVSWGVFLQPLLVLSLMLLVCLGLAALLKVLQTMLVEVIQRRQLVRVVGDLAHRFPRARRGQFQATYPRELANRVFDIMTIQKATAVLLFDGISIMLTTMLGLVLLAAYHPYLLGFDIILVVTMVTLTLLLGRNGIRSAIDESITKYRIAHWLQDVIDFPAAFRINGGEKLAIDRANRLTTDYLQARQAQFRVVLRQVVFAAALQVVASTTLLGLGGWLVINGELTLGQLVASELVVTVVVGAFAKAGKSLEKFYDLMAGIDKVGHLLDVQVDPRATDLSLPDPTSLTLTWDALQFPGIAGSTRWKADRLQQGQIVALRDAGCGSRHQMAEALAGLHAAQTGAIQLGGHDVRQWTALNQVGPIALAGNSEVFHGSVLDNVSLARATVGRSRVRECLQGVNLWESVTRMKQGMDTMLQTGGKPMNPIQVAQLMLARALAGRPRLLVIDGLLDLLGEDTLQKVWPALQLVAETGVVVLTTNRSDIADRCSRTIWTEDGK